MSRRKKRLEKLRRNQKNVSFKDLRLVLEDCGFELVRSSGSHHSFSVTIEGESRLFVVPYKHPVKPVYVREALKLIDQILAEQEELELEEEDIEEEEQDDEE